MDVKINTVVDNNSDQKCQKCVKSICCTYVTQQIDTPDEKSDFEQILWQISHKNVHVYKDDDGWFLLFLTECEHLEENGRCSIYLQRPAICQEYDNDYCEYDSPAEEGFELYFTSYQELFTYVEKNFAASD